MLIGVGIQGQNRDRDALLMLNPDAILVMDGDIEEIKALRARGWNGQVFLRFYHPDMMGVSGTQRALEHNEWLRNHTDIPFAGIIPANELNLDDQHSEVPYPGFWKSPEGYKRIESWLISYYKTSAYKWLLHWPALGGDQNQDFQPFRQSLWLYPFHDIHVYGPLTENGSLRLKPILAALDQYGGLHPRFVTEVNQLDYVDFLRFAKEQGIEGCFWFLWWDDLEDWGKYNLAPWTDLANLKRYIEEKEKSMTLAEQFPARHAQWVADGGDPEGNFRRLLMALGDLPSTRADYERVCEDLKSAAEEAKRIGLAHFQ